MTHLIKWQFISMISRFLAMVIGIVQGIFVVRLLSTSDYGLVGVVTAVGSIAGIVMHLGLVSGATREIAAAAVGEGSNPLRRGPEGLFSRAPSVARGETGLDPGPSGSPAGELAADKAFKIFISALLARLAIALPIFLILFFGAPIIAGRVYDHLEITAAVRLYALILLVQAPQGIFNAALSGLKKFKSVFIFQVAIALTSLALYVPLIWKLGFYGYFWSMLVLAVVHTTVLCLLVWKVFRLPISRPEFSKREIKARRWASFLPSLTEICISLRKVFSVGLSIYLVKIIFTLWQRFGPLVLGRAASVAEVGIFNFALFYSTKLMTASDAITDVNLSVFSGQFSQEVRKGPCPSGATSRVAATPVVDGLDEFKAAFLANFQKIYVFITLAAVSAIYWSPELVRLVVGHKYDDSLQLIPWLVGAFWCYSFINIIKSSLLVPAKLNRDMIISYALLLIGTVGGYYGLRHFEPVIPNLFRDLGLGPTLPAMAFGMLLGGILAIIYQWLALCRTLNLNIFTRQTFTLTLLLAFLIIPYGLSFGLWFKLAIFVANLGLFLYFLDRFQILPWEQVLVRVRLFRSPAVERGRQGKKPVF